MNWKLADVTPIPKRKPVKDVKKDLKPISLTTCLSKLAEDLVVTNYVKPAALRVLDDRQYGAVPKSSTTLALLEMIHCWTNATDGNGSSVRTILFDYRKAFDLIDHKILITKLSTLNLPHSIINWIIDFLTNRQQRTKLAEGCVSEWGLVPSGVPQGTKLGPWLFVIIIIDLSILDAALWKYVDDTTVSEIIPKGQSSSAQEYVDSVADWSADNRFQLNIDKCKEIRISFSKNNADLPPLFINGQELEVVQNAKLLGVTITNNLSWNLHINETIKKASKRLYFLRQLKRARVPTSDLVRFYTCCIRSVCDYAVPVFHSSLPNYLINDLERVQKRALSIICPHLSYNESLAFLDMDSLFDHHSFLCSSLFSKILDDEEHKLHHLLPPRHTPKYNFRQSRVFDLSYKTNRTKNSFINFQCNLINNNKNVY